MPWHVVPDHAGCPASKPWAVVKDSDGSVAGCHPTKTKAQKQLATLNLNVKEAPMGEDCFDCDEHFESRAVDDTDWNGGAAMTACSNSETPAACFGAICAGRKAGPPEQRNSHKLPHHKSPGSPPNRRGVIAALRRFDQTQALTNRAEARRHLERHMASIQAQSASTASRPPRDDLVRAAPGGYALRWEDEETGMPVMFGHFARFNEWTEIDSVAEGHFMERMAPGSLTKSFQEPNRSLMKPLFQHGRDPSIGDKVLGPIREAREDDVGGYYEVPLLDTSYNRDLIPGLDQGLYGASFRFRVQREDWVRDTRESKYNPKGLPERTIREAHVMEFGPVTFPAYMGATAGVRSLTDEYLMDKFLSSPDRTLAIARELAYRGDEDEGDAATAAVDAGQEATSTDDADVRAGAEPHPDSTGTSPEQKHAPKEVTMENGTPSVEELEARNKEISARVQQIDAEYGTRQLAGEDKEEYDRLTAEHDGNVARIAEATERRARIAKMVEQDPSKAKRVYERTEFHGTKSLPPGEDLFDLSTVRNAFTEPEKARRELKDRAHKAIDEARNFPESRSKEDYQARAHYLVDAKDGPESWLARRILYTGHPGYEEAFWRKVGNKGLSGDQEKLIERAMTTATEGNIAVPFTLDPTVILTSDGSANPLRQIGRVETITSHTWKGVASTAMSLGYAGEAAEVGDDSPTLSQPSVVPLRADAFVPFSVELDQDWGQLRTEMTRLIQDGKDDLEATKFALGTGVPSEPQGVLVGAGTFTVTTAGTAAFVVADLYKLEEDLGPRFRARASILGSKFIFNKVRQFDTGGGAALWVRLEAGQPPELIGYPAYEQSEMAAALTAGGTILCIGDFRNFLIVDRVGMDVELVPHLFGTANNRPTGQRGFLAIWRNSSVVLNANAFRKLLTLS